MTKLQWTEAMDGSPAWVPLPIPGEVDGLEDAAGHIKFQAGPISEFGRNGTTIEAVIQVLIDRLRGFNENPVFRCRENSLAITHLEEALHWLWARTRARQEQGVEGKNIPHIS